MRASAERRLAAPLRHGWEAALPSPEAEQAGRHGGQRPQRGGAAANLRQHGKLGHSHQAACMAARGEGGGAHATVTHSDDCWQPEASVPAPELPAGGPFATPRPLTCHGGSAAPAPQRRAQRLVCSRVERPHIGRPVRVAQPARKGEQAAQQLRSGRAGSGGEALARAEAWRQSGRGTGNGHNGWGSLRGRHPCTAARGRHGTELAGRACEQRMCGVHLWQLSSGRKGAQRGRKHGGHTAAQGQES